MIIKILMLLIQVNCTDCKGTLQSTYSDCLAVTMECADTVMSMKINDAAKARLLIHECKNRCMEEDYDSQQSR